MGKDYFGNDFDSGIDCFFGANSQIYKDSLKELLEGTENLYLCGCRLSYYLNPKNNFFSNYYRYLNYPPIFELIEPTVLFMIALKPITSAKLVQGETDGVRQSWVEFKYCDEKFVAGLIWGTPFIMTREQFYSNYCEVIPRWIMGHKDFWDLTLTKSIYSCMQAIDTSEGVFEYLSEYHRGEGNWGVNNVFSEIKEPGFFYPFKKNKKIVSSGIIKQLLIEDNVSQREVQSAYELLKSAQAAV